MFTILKDVAGIWWHVFNNEATKVHLSDFDVVIEAVSETYIIEAKNGSNIPSRSISISDVQVINENISSSPISFSGADGLIALLTSLNYPPYLSNTTPQPPVKVWTKGQGSYFRRTQAWIDANFDSSGLGINEAIGWEKDTDAEGKVLIGQTDGGLFDNIGNSYGFANTVLPAHEADSAVLVTGGVTKKGVNDAGTGATVNGYTLVSGTALGKIVKTSKVGQDHTGAFSDTETGANKNYQPSLIVLFVKRTEDLWIIGSSSSSAVPNLTQVLTQSDILPYTIPIPNDTFVTFDLGRELTENYFTTDDVGTGGVFLDKDVVFPDNSTIRFQAGYVEDNVTPTDVTLLPYRFATDAYVFYQGARVTDITLQPEDVCTLKLDGDNSTDSIQIWHLTVVSKSSGGSVDPADLISTDTDNTLVLGTDNKLFVPEGTTPIDASGGGTTISDGVIEHADGRIKFGSNIVDTEAGLYDVSGDRQIATYSEIDDIYYFANGSFVFNNNTGELFISGDVVKTQTQNDARYIQQEAWVDYSATSTVVGWSSFTTKKISYKIIDDAMIIDFNIEGTSNATTISFTIPSNASSATFVLSAYIINNGSGSSNPGRINSASGSNVITVQRDGQNTAFTASGTKRCSGQITIQL